MSQAKNLPSIKKIELSVRQMTPPLNRDGTRPQLVGALEDGSPIYLGDIFDGHPAFRNEAGGHRRTPAQGPDGDVWRLNKATGQKIIQVFNNERTFSKQRYIMRDFGNGNAGPIPVPNVQRDETDAAETFDTLKAVLKAEGLSLKEFVSAIKANALAAGEEEPVAAPDEPEVSDSANPEPPKKRRGRPPKAKDT